MIVSILIFAPLLAYNKLAKYLTNCFILLTKMAATPIYGIKIFIKSSTPEPEGRSMTLEICM